MKDILIKDSQCVKKAKITAYGGFDGALVYETNVEWDDGDKGKVFLPVSHFKDIGIIQRVNGVSKNVQQWLNTEEGKWYIKQRWNLAYSK